MSPTDQFITRLSALGPGDLARLRRCAGMPLHQDMEAFDLFTGLWWPLRRNNPRVPARDPSWLVGKLFPWNTRVGAALRLSVGLGRIAPHRPEDARRDRRRFDALLAAQGAALEAALQQGVRRLDRAQIAIDWGRLLDDLRCWKYPERRVQFEWAQDYLNSRKGASRVD